MILPGIEPGEDGLPFNPETGLVNVPRFCERNRTTMTSAFRALPCADVLAS